MAGHDDGTTGPPHLGQPDPTPTGTATEELTALRIAYADLATIALSLDESGRVSPDDGQRHFLGAATGRLPLFG